MERGLLLKPEWADLFASGCKTMDVRSHNVRCVKSEETVFIVASGQGKNANGATVLKIVGHMKFVRNVTINPNEFSALFDEHRVPNDHLQKMLVGWKREGGNVYGWKFKDIVKLQTPCWIKWHNDSWLLTCLFPTCQVRVSRFYQSYFLLLLLLLFLLPAGPQPRSSRSQCALPGPNLNRELQISVGPIGTDCRASTASSTSQGALLQISVALQDLNCDNRESGACVEVALPMSERMSGQMPDRMPGRTPARMPDRVPE